MEKRIINKVSKRICSEIENKLNDAINLEQMSAQKYEQMSMWCDFAGYNNTKSWFKTHAGEERKHSDWVMEFMMDKNCMPLTQDIAKTEPKWKTMSDLLEDAYKHEELVTDTWNNIATFCLRKGDHDAYRFALRMCEEQREEIDLFSGLIDLYNLSDGDSDLTFDNHVKHPD